MKFGVKISSRKTTDLTDVIGSIYQWCLYVVYISDAYEWWISVVYISGVCKWYVSV